jgi:hypothetical protein
MLENLRDIPEDKRRQKAHFGLQEKTGKTHFSKGEY